MVQLARLACMSGAAMMFGAIIVLRMDHMDMTSIRFAYEYWPGYAIMFSFIFTLLVLSDK